VTEIKNLGASIRARLLNKARAENLDYNLVLTRFALERWLYRLSISDYRDEFLLKGALLFDLWFDVPHRPTRDADLLGSGSADITRLESMFREICAIPFEDAIEFQSDSIRAERIRKDGNYPGIRITLVGLLDSARCPVQVDIGFGDAVTPGPEAVDYPAMLDEMPGPSLDAYPRYSVVSEKLEALVALGIANSRMKDFFDLWILSRQSEFDGETLRRHHGNISSTLDAVATCHTHRALRGVHARCFQADAMARVHRQERSGTDRIVRRHLGS